MAMARSPLFEQLGEGQILFECALCGTLRRSRPLMLGSGVVSLQHRVVLAPLTRLRASEVEMAPQAMCVLERCSLRPAPPNLQRLSLTSTLFLSMFNQVKFRRSAESFLFKTTNMSKTWTH